MLKIIDLHVEVEGKEILKGVNLEVKDGSTHALMGPNGSGKSTLAHVLLGHPKYVVTRGSIVFEGEDITGLAPNERAKKGLFLSFQYPKEIAGVTISNFLRTILNSRGKEAVNAEEFEEKLKGFLKKLNISEEFLSRGLNEGFSGGEKKKAEILQLLMLNPLLAILDETDSGLDIDALRVVSEGINLFKEGKKSVLVITHYKRILDYLKPDEVSILKEGKIVMQGEGSLVEELESKGYDWMSDATN